MAKYIFVTGGVVSSLGKGITAASLGRLLKKPRAESNNSKNLIPYINIDPGTMSPYQARRGVRHRRRSGDDLDLGPL